MNVEMEKIFSFSALVLDADHAAWINTWDIRIHMRALGDNRDHNTAYSRMKFWFTDIMQDSMLLSNDHEQLSAWRHTGMRTIEFPTKPVDQVIGLMLMSKLNAMAEGRLEVSQVSVTSLADDLVTYFCDHGDHLHWFEEEGWWRDSSPNHAMTLRRNRSSGKVIAMSRANDWKNHDLDWGTVPTNTNNISVLASRNRDDPQ